MPLHLKIEGFVEKAYKKCCSFEMRKSFLIPDKSIFADLDQFLND